MNTKTKKLTTLAMLTAIAYLMVMLIRIPVFSTVDFLKYEPKDVIIGIGGFIFGPFSSFAISVVVSLLEMITFSTTGPWGCLMNIISTCSFICTAAYIYKKKHTLSGAILGLVVGGIFMVAVMMLWNYLVTPIYMGYPRETVASMLLPFFLPYNAIKAAINGSIIMLLYKPVITALRKTHLVEESTTQAKVNKAHTIGIVLVAAAVLITCIFVVLVLRGIL